MVLFYLTGFFKEAGVEVCCGVIQTCRVLSLFCTPSIWSSQYLSLWGSYYSPYLQMKKLRVISRLTAFSWATFGKERGWDLNSDFSDCKSSHAPPKVMWRESWLKTKHSHLHWIQRCCLVHCAERKWACGGNHCGCLLCPTCLMLSKQNLCDVITELQVLWLPIHFLA